MKENNIRPSDLLGGFILRCIITGGLLFIVFKMNMMEELSLIGSQILAIILIMSGMATVSTLRKFREYSEVLTDRVKVEPIWNLIGYFIIIGAGCICLILSLTSLDIPDKSLFGKVLAMITGMIIVTVLKSLTVRHSKRR